MRKRVILSKLMILVVLIATLLNPILAAAQEEVAQAPAEAETAQAAPTAGLTILILLVGLGAVALVGARMWLRDSYEGDSNT
jgi:hypothetical protein